MLLCSCDWPKTGASCFYLQKNENNCYTVGRRGGGDQHRVDMLKGPHLLVTCVVFIVDWLVLSC